MNTSIKCTLIALSFFIASTVIAQSEPVCASQSSPNANEQAVAAASADTSKKLDRLLAYVAKLKQTGQTQQATQITLCLRANAHDELTQISQLVSQSRLYESSLSNGADSWFDLGSPAVTKDFLSRQLARSQVLLGYSNPYVVLLQNLDASNDVRTPYTSGTSYWSNSISELNRYVQFTDVGGQVGVLEKLITNLALAKKSDCKAWLSAYRSVEFGNDLFSEARQKLEKIAQLSCK
jgi:type VI secretion system protein ImpL